MNTFKPSILTLSLLAAGLSFSGISIAADATAEEAAAKAKAEKKANTQPTETIQIKGFRGSVIKSLNTKRYSDTVVDAISADDIGGLPDVSIADSLTRLPGVTSVRVDGQSSELNIRGLSGGFVFSTLNGREQVSSAGGRAVQFDQFPSELIEQAQVYKSQKASLIEGGVAGTIELKTANALDNEEDSTFRFSSHGNWNEAAADNEDSDSIGHRVTVSYQKKLFEDTFGVSVGYARMFQPTVSSRFVNYQFDKAENIHEIYDGAPEGLLTSSGFEINERGGEDTRDAFVLGLNWEPRDDFRLQVDSFYSEFDSDKWDRGLRVSGLNNIDQRGSSLSLVDPIISNGALIGGTYIRNASGLVEAPPLQGSDVTMNVQTQADNNSTSSKLFSFGVKGEWDISDRLQMTVDFAHSEADETYVDQVLRMAVFEDANAETPIIDNNLIMSYQLNGLGIPDVEFNQDFTDINKVMVTSAESYPHVEENSADAVRIDFKYELDNEYFSSFETGIRVSEREYQLDRARFLYGTTDFDMRNGQYIQYAGTDEDGNPIEVGRFAPFQLTADLATVTGVGGDLSGMPNFLAVNNNEILNAWIPGVDRTPIKDWGHDWTLTQGNKVKEEVTAAYFQANMDMELFGLPVSGNIGLRVIETDQSSTGLLNVGEGNGTPITDGLGVTKDKLRRGTKGIKYTDYLPSLNLNFSLTDNDQLRFAFAQVLARPDMKKMANSGNFNFNRDNQTGQYLANLDSSTSPLLRPFYADQIDISYEHYLDDGNGAFVFAVWNKDIDSMVEDIENKNFDFAAAGIEIPAAPEEQAFDPDTGELIVWENGTYKRAENSADAGYIRGVEIAYTQTFTSLPGAWAGLGMNLNFSYTESEIEVSSAVPGEEDELSPIEGLSPRVYSATIFYDYEELFSARLSARHRAAYLSKQVAIGSDQAAYFEDETILSAQLSYNITENLQAVVSVDNLTDEANISYFGDTARTGTIQYFGRTVYFGVNYKL